MNAPVVKKQRRKYGTGKNGKPRVGVTTVLGETLGWSKTGLMMWAAKEAATFAVDEVHAGGARDEVIERARKAHLKIRDAAADAGTLAHEYVEAYLRTGALPPEDLFNEETETQQKARRAFNRFVAWWPTSGYEVVDLELPLVDENKDFGGTIDLVLRRKSDGALIVGDVKTGKSVYDEVLLQLGAYAVLLSVHGRDVKGGLVVHCPVDGQPHFVDVSLTLLEKAGASFLFLLAVHHAREDLKLNLDSMGGVP